MKQPSELLQEHSVHKENIVTPTNVNAKDIEARLVRVNGLVQGVGFRPTVWRIAAALNLRGEVFNDPQGVGVRLEGDPQALDAFPAALRRECPPLARIDTLEIFPAETVGFTDFRIVKSETAGEVSTMITPDASVCRACLTEVFTPANRLHQLHALRSALYDYTRPSLRSSADVHGGVSDVSGLSEGI